MRGWRGGWLGLAGLALAGCAVQPHAPQPPNALALLQSGQPLLACREACLPRWRESAGQAAQLDAAGRWAELATLLVRVGYQDDLTLYYLARAAEGLGHKPAAASYYRQSVAFSSTAQSCRHASRVCGGVVLPQAALSRLAALERELVPPRRRARPSRRPPEPPPATVIPEPAAAPATAAIPAPAPLPAPTPAPVPPPPEPPRSAPAAPGTSEFIEPPPLVR